MSQANSGYHHGDLRDALILAAAALIEEQGSLSFSITDAAKRAGVTQKVLRLLVNKDFGGV